MSRIQETFTRLRLQNRKALIPFITAGDPNLAQALTFMFALVEGGADMIELGVPFSDPMADGPVIQRASERALAQGVSLSDVLHLVRDFRKQNQHTPIILMGYANPVEQMGMTRFAQLASESGVDGVLIVDLAFDEMEKLSQTLQLVDVDWINLIASTTSEERIAKIVQLTRGYVYYVSLKGVTGSRNLNVDEIERKIALIQQKTTLPIAVGFGIRDARSAVMASRLADGVILGSSLVQLIETMDHLEIKSVLTTSLKEIRDALDQAYLSVNA